MENAEKSGGGTEATVAAEEKHMKDTTIPLNGKVRGKQLPVDGKLSIIFENEPAYFQKVYQRGSEPWEWHSKSQGAHYIEPRLIVNEMKWV